MSDDDLDETLTQLKELMGDAFGHLVETFLGTSQGYMESIAQGLTDKDASKIRDAAHPLKSSSGNMGFSELSALCKQMEGLANEADGDGALFVQIEDLYEKAKSRYEDAVKKLESLEV